MSQEISYGLKKLEVGSLRERVYERIKGMILTNKLRPSQDIVIDRLARELGVSHTPIREALSILESDGLVESDRHRTPRVSPIREGDVAEVYEVRVLLEGWATFRAAQALSDDQLESMSALLQQASQEAFNLNYGALISADIEFHQVILNSIENGVFHRAAMLVHDLSLRIRSLVESSHPGPVIEQIMAEHIAVLDALVARDAEKARSCMVDHLEAARDRTLEALKRDPSLEN